MKDVQVITGGLNHFAFLMGLKNLKTLNTKPETPQLVTRFAQA